MQILNICFCFDIKQLNFAPMKNRLYPQITLFCILKNRKACYVFSKIIYKILLTIF